MSPATRTLAWVAVLGVLLGMALGGLLVSCTDHGRPVLGGASPSVVDTGRVVAVRDSLDALQLRRRLDSTLAWIASAPPESVLVTLPGWHDTIHDTTRVPVPVVVIRETADSLAQCHHDRDSATGDGLLWRERDKAHAEALKLCQRSLGGTPATSSGGTHWTVSAVLQADGDALRPGVGVDWRPFEHLQVGAEGYARRDFTKPGAGLRLGFSF